MQHIPFVFILCKVYKKDFLKFFLTPNFVSNNILIEGKSYPNFKKLCVKVTVLTNKGYIVY